MKELTVQQEKSYSAYLSFQTKIDLLDMRAEAQADDASDFPKLCYLRIELHRLRTGMTDFIIRVASPRYEGVERSNTMFTVRAGADLAKMNGVTKLAKKISEEMETREDATHKWDQNNIDHLAKLLYGRISIFAKDKTLEGMSFSTEALL